MMNIESYDIIQLCNVDDSALYLGYINLKLYPINSDSEIYMRIVKNRKPTTI